MMKQSTVVAHNVYFTIFIKMTEQIPLGKSISISRSGSYGTSGKLVRASVSEFSRFDSTITPVEKHKRRKKKKKKLVILTNTWISQNREDLEH